MIVHSSAGILVSFLSVFYYLWLLIFDNGVTAVINAPDNIKPGETVIAEVIINKGNTGGFAKLQLEVGQGITISEEDNKGATFSFSGNTAKWIWTALPLEAEFKVKFKITASSSASGNTSISGKFSYIVNNAKQVVEIPTKNITIGNASAEPIAQTPPPAENTTTTNVQTPTNVNVVVETTTTNEAPPVTSIATETNVTTNTTSITTPQTSSDILLKRNITNIAPTTWLIQISIQKANIKGFARYNDVLPPGLTAKAEEKDGSSFFVDGNTIKFVWSSLPDKETLVISYKITGNITSPVTLNGDFSYTENNQVLTKSLSPESIQPASVSDNATPSTTLTTTTTPTNASQTETSIAEQSINAKQTSVFFSVQLGAFLKSNISSYYFTKKYNINNVTEESHESYKKFYTGNFEEYKQARDYREKVKQKGIQDAFVIAHKSNTRISVQEALMITNQKWYP
ncbi:MAG: hypothetical protein OHK0036_09160 [Bacteroidia bacterium]